MMSQVEQTVVTLQGKIDSEKAAREKADVQVEKMMVTVDKLTSALDEKADQTTIEQISKTLHMIQSTVRSEQVARKDSEKQMTMIKQAMTKLYHKPSKKEKEVRVVREIQETHHIK